MVWPKIIFDLWRRKKRELENNWTIFETCALNPFHGQKVKENFFPTGSREDRSLRKRHLSEVVWLLILFPDCSFLSCLCTLSPFLSFLLTSCNKFSGNILSVVSDFGLAFWMQSLSIIPKKEETYARTWWQKGRSQFSVMCLLVLAFFGVPWWLNLKPEALIYLLQHNGRRLLGEGCLFSVFKIMQSVRKKSVHVSLKRVKYNGKRNCYSS